MFKLLKAFHLIGLTLFLGSIAIYIVEGTPMTTPYITAFVRAGVLHDIKTLTLPGLILMILTGVGMILVRRQLLVTRFFKIKLVIGLIVLINAINLYSIAQHAALAASQLPIMNAILNNLVLRESLFGAVNVILVLFLIFYSVSAQKYAKSHT